MIHLLSAVLRCSTGKRPPPSWAHACVCERAARSILLLRALAINVRFAVGAGPPGGQLRSDQICGVGAGLCAGGTGQRQTGMLLIIVRWSACDC